MIVRGARALAVAVVVVALCGCVPESDDPPFAVARPASTPPVVAPVSPSPTPDASSVDAACEGGVAYLTGESTSLRLASTCARVEVAGEDLRVDLAGAVIDGITVRGEGNIVVAGSLASVVIEGQRNSLEATGIGSGTVRGDDNRVDVRGDLGALTVQGGGNSVVADTLGAVTDQGEGNSIAPR